MRTRRSPRNQERLWKALGKQAKPTAAHTENAPKINQCWNCNNYPNHGRNRGHCTVHGVMVYGRTENKPCFIPKVGLII